MSTQPKPSLTPEQYLEIARKAEFRSQCYQGEMFAMSGAQEVHILIAGNAMGRSYNISPPMQSVCARRAVCVAPTGIYTYPV
jgi:Uma2 family endonuclease